MNKVQNSNHSKIRILTCAPPVKKIARKRCTLATVFVWLTSLIALYSFLVAGEANVSTRFAIMGTVGSRVSKTVSVATVFKTIIGIQFGQSSSKMSNNNTKCNNKIAMSRWTFSSS